MFFMLIICFLSNIITEVTRDIHIFLLDIFLQILLFEPPIGEGGLPHLANHKELRPALDWSIIEGWTVPLSAVSF
jgi:hypothetical protein